MKATQTLYGSRDTNRHFELVEDAQVELGEHEIRFITARDSFYQASVSESGRPYVQHRGDPAGFVTVLDARTIGYPDFRGNVQYLSVGNLAANDRISLIMVDYAIRRRLNLWGQARIVHESEQPELLVRLALPSYRARIERRIVIRLDTWSWNCPQHITQRYSKAEMERLINAVISR